MKSMTKMIGLVRTLCVTAIVSLLAQSVWAAMPAPVATWSGTDLASGTVNNGYTISYSDGASFADNVITLTESSAVAYQGVKIALPEGFSGDALTVTVKYTDYSNPSANRALFSFTENDTEEINGYANGNTLKSSSVRYPGVNYTEKKQANFTIPTAGMMYFSLDKTSQGLKYGFATGDDASGYNAPIPVISEPELKAAAFKEIHIGGCYAKINWYYRIGLKVSEIKVYACTYDDLVKGSMAEDYQTFADNFSARIVTWTTTAASASTAVDMGNAAASFQSYNAMIGENVGQTYAGNGTTYTSLPCWTGNGTLAWRAFCPGQAGYTAPGLVLRFPTYKTGTGLYVKGSFGPFTLGGLIVEENAGSGATKPKLEWDKDRDTSLGDTRDSGSVPTFFILKDTFQINRGLNINVYGDITFDIASGKLLEIVSGKVVPQTGAVLRLKGAGQIKTAGVVNANGSKNINMSGVTLDFSGKTSANTVAYFDGQLTISDTTTIIFPENLDENTPFTLCTGTLTAPTEPVVTTRVVGGEEQEITLTYNASAKTVSYKVNRPMLADDLVWLPIGDSITEGEQYMGHPDQGDVDTRGGYRYQLWKTMEAAGQPTVTVGYRTGHSGTTEPDDCRWARHAAQYGGVIMHDNNGSHGAAGMNVESTLEVAGYPDVITVLIGVNDCSMTNSSDDQIGKVFQTWVNMIEKLSALRPKSSIYVSTLLPSGQGRATYIDKFNVLVRAAATSNASPFNLANVTFADMHKEAFNDEFTASYFKAADALHPNETGAVILANAFAEHLKSAVAARAQNAAELVSVDNGTAGFVTVRFNKALKSVTSATLTITGTNVADEEVTLTLENGTIDEANKRLLKFATSTELKGGTYTATITNLAGSDGNGLALPASLSITDSKFVEILGSGAADNVPASLLEGFVKHGTLAMSDGTVNNGIGSGDNFAGNGPGNQFTTDAALPQYVKRVAYYMELKRPGQPAQFVWASMDASTGFGSRSINVGIPTSTSSNIKSLVNNLQVYGNRGNFTNSVIDSEGNSADVGIVEFSPYDWSGNDQSGFPQDFNANYCGWNDTLGSSTLKGCMQIAKVLRTSDFDNYTKPGAQMLFAYNNFNRANTTDIGIGSFTSHRNNAGGTCSVVHDWTDIVSGTGMKAIAVNAYEVKKLEIWTEEGEAPSDLYIAASETVTKSASDPLTLPVRGSGRLILENYLPTDSAVLQSLQNSATWTGTVEIKNYTKPTGDNYGIIYFQNYANANSTVALNGVTSTIYTNGGNQPDQTFGKLEIMEGGWTSHSGTFTNNSPLYNCNLAGSGTITINHPGAGIVNFCGDHSNFSGAINFAANADKGVVLAPANTGRTTSGVSARQILVHANTTVRIAGSVNGTVKLAARDSVKFFDVNAYGNTDTTVELMGIGGGYVTAENPTSSPKIVLSGNVAFTDGFSGKSTTWTEVSGSGNFSVSKGSSGSQNYVISTLKGYTGSITAKSNTTLTIGSVVTTLATIPTTSTKIVNYGTDCVKDKVLITGLTVKLANGTDITADINLTVENDGIYIVIKPAPEPTEGKTFPEDTIITKEVVNEDGTTETVTISGTTIPDETGVYTVKASENGEAETYGVIAAKEEEVGETPAKVTTAVAVPFTGATVANLLNTALLANGDTLMAYITVDETSGYAKWTLTDGAWVGNDITGGIAAQSATTALKRGTAVWVTTAGKVVVLGKYDTETEIAAPTTKETHLLANPTMGEYTPAINDGDKNDQVIEIGTAKPTRFTKKNGKWTAPVFVEHNAILGDVYREQEVSPKIPVGKGFWFIKK